MGRRRVAADRKPGERAEAGEARRHRVARLGVVEPEGHPLGGGRRGVLIGVEESLVDDQRQLMVLVVAIDIVNISARCARLAAGDPDVRPRPVRAVLDRQRELVVAAVDPGPVGRLVFVADPQEGMVRNDRAVRLARKSAVAVGQHDRPEPRMGRMVRVGVGRRGDVEVGHRGAHRSRVVGGDSRKAVVHVLGRRAGVLEQVGVGGVPADEVAVADRPRAVVGAVEHPVARQQAFAGVRDEQRLLGDVVGREHQTGAVVDEDIVAIEDIVFRTAAADPGVDGGVVRIPGALVHHVRRRVVPALIGDDRVALAELVEDIESVHATVRGVAGEAAQRLLVGLQPGVVGDVLRRRERGGRHDEPVAGPLGSGGDVVLEDVVRIGDPEAGGRAVLHLVVGIVRGGDFLPGGRPFRQQHDVAADHVEALRPVFEEEPVAQVVVAEIVLHRGVVGAVDGDGPVEGAVDRAVAEILSRTLVEAQVPVEGIAAEQALLAGPGDLHALEAADPRRVGHSAHRHRAMDHHMRPKAVIHPAGRHRVGRALDRDVAGQQADFRPQVRGPGLAIGRPRVALDGSAMGKGQRAGEDHGPPVRADAADLLLLALVPVGPGRGDHHSVAGPPIDRFGHGDRGRSGGGRCAEPGPLHPVLAMHRNRPAHQRQQSARTHAVGVAR